MKFDTYTLEDSVFDEMFEDDGRVRAHYQPLYDALSEVSTNFAKSLQERTSRSFTNEGITFTVYNDEETDERIIPIDSLPRILTGAEWRDIASGLKQRLAALNQFLQDVYGKATIVSDGVIPVDVVRGCRQYRIEMRGVEVPHGTWVAICGSDLVRTHEGFRVLEDNLRVPSGVSYMVANRKVTKHVMRQLYRRCGVQEVEHYGRLLRQTLRELAPHGRGDPCIVLLTPGVFNSAFYEHMFLAQEIGAELVEGRDLVVNDGYVYMRTTSGLRRVDVIYRRIDDDYLDPLVFRRDSLLGVPGLIHAFKRGHVTLANAPGTGIADDKSVYSYVPDMIRYYLNEEPLLQNVDTFLCRRPEDLEYTLDNLDKLVVKRVDGSGGYGILIGPQSTPEQRNAMATRLRESPEDFVSQPTLPLSRSPCLFDGQPEPRHVDLRPFVLHGAETRIVSGAFCRVALRRGSLVVNSSQGAAERISGCLRTRAVHPTDNCVSASPQASGREAPSRSCIGNTTRGGNEADASLRARPKGGRGKPPCGVRFDKPVLVASCRSALPLTTPRPAIRGGPSSPAKAVLWPALRATGSDPSWRAAPCTKTSHGH